METDRSQKQVVQEIVAGRTLEEQMECVKKYGNHGFTIPSVLRGVILQALGACREPKQTAKNLLMFGCYLPFSSPFMVRDCIRLLDLLGLDYTYLEQEFCCGSPMVQVSTGMERKRAIAMGKKFIQLNRDMAQQRCATTMAYCCAGCATMTKGIFPADKRHRHVYILDLIIEKLGKETLRVEPTVAGYFEGCHSRFRNIFPEVNLDWERYRQLLDRIEGL
jgi:Fe-S oxidoreductase